MVNVEYRQIGTNPSITYKLENFVATAVYML